LYARQSAGLGHDDPPEPSPDDPPPDDPPPEEPPAEEPPPDKPWSLAGSSSPGAALGDASGEGLTGGAGTGSGSGVAAQPAPASSATPTTAASRRGWRGLDMTVPFALRVGPLR